MTEVPEVTKISGHRPGSVVKMIPPAELPEQTHTGEIVTLRGGLMRPEDVTTIHKPEDKTKLDHPGYEDPYAIKQPLKGKVFK